MSRRDANVLLRALTLFALVAFGLTCCGPETPARSPARQPTGTADEGPTPVVPHFTVRGRWRDPLQLTYRIEERSGPMAKDAFVAAITRACEAWTATGIVKFAVAAGEAKADVTLGWRRGHHGACEPFSKDTAVAHSGPVKSGTFVHFDAGRKWVADADHDRDGYSLYGTALHELGHVLGLGHSTASDAVMRTGAVRSAPLSASDLLGLQSLYGGGKDAVGDLLITSAAGELLSVLRGVVATGITEFAVFDVDGVGGDEVLVWRTDRAGSGQLMIYHFDEGAKLARTTGPFAGAMANGADNLLLVTESNHRVLLTTYKNGRRIARHFDQYGVLKGFSAHLIGDAELAAAQQSGNAHEGDLDGDGQRERLVLIE